MQSLQPGQLEVAHSSHTDAAGHASAVPHIALQSPDEKMHTPSGQSAWAEQDIGGASLVLPVEVTTASVVPLVPPVPPVPLDVSAIGPQPSHSAELPRTAIILDIAA